MSSALEIFAKAGSAMRLPFLFLFVVCLQPEPASAKDTGVVAFQQIDSSCIDLARYDREEKRLTVHFVSGREGEFYRYSNVPPALWERLRSLNKTGGVGSYFTATIVQHPQGHPFEKVFLTNFVVMPKKQKSRKP